MADLSIQDLAKTFKGAGFVLCVGVVLLPALWLAWIVLRWDAPPLGLSRRGPTITFNVSTWGEYPTTVTRIRLSDLSNRSVLWELNADNSEPQIGGFSLSEGDNPVQVATENGSYRAVAPSNSATFTLRKGPEYKLELWGGSGILEKPQRRSG